MEVNSKKTNVGLDFAKFIAALMVVAIHTNAFKDQNFALYEFCSYCVFTFAVPFFFICSGYLLGTKISHTLDSSGYKEVIKKYFFRLLYPYLIWGIWYFILSSLIGIIRNNTSPIDSFVYQFRLWLVSSPGGGLWYIQTILIILMLLYIDKKKEHIGMFTVISLVLSFVPTIIEQFNKESSIIGNIYDFYYRFFLTDLNFVWWGVFFLIGLCLAIYGKSVMLKVCKYRVQYLVLFYVVYIFTYFMIGKGIVLHGMKILVSVFLFIAVLDSKLKFDPVISITFRKMSTLIYFTHFTFIYIVQIMFKLFGLDYGTHLTLAWLISSSAVGVYSFVLVVCLPRNPLMWLYERKNTR